MKGESAWDLQELAEKTALCERMLGEACHINIANKRLGGVVDEQRWTRRGTLVPRSTEILMKERVGPTIWGEVPMRFPQDAVARAVMGLFPLEMVSGMEFPFIKG